MPMHRHLPRAAAVAVAVAATCAGQAPALAAEHAVAAPVGVASAADRGPYDVGSCGRMDIRVRPDGVLKLKAGRPGRLTIDFATERPCGMNVVIRPYWDGRTGGLAAAPDNFVPVSMPGTHTWTLTASHKGSGFLAAGLSGSGRSFVIRLNDVTVR